MNMSYCRFQNTKKDLNDCLTALNEGNRLSGKELEACREMFESFLEFCEENEIITEDWRDGLDEYIEGAVEDGEF